MTDASWQPVSINGSQVRVRLITELLQCAVQGAGRGLPAALTRCYIAAAANHSIILQLYDYAVRTAPASERASIIVVVIIIIIRVIISTAPLIRDFKFGGAGGRSCRLHVSCIRPDREKNMFSAKLALSFE